MKKLLLILGVFFTCALAARAQTVNTKPVVGQQQIANAVACSSTPLSFLINNNNQAFNYVFYKTAGTPTSFNLTVMGTFDGTNFFQVSDTATDPVSGQIRGLGYFPRVNVQVTCSGGTGPTVSIWASTTSESTGEAFTQLDSGVYQKVITDGGAAGTNLTTTFLTPYGNTAGWVVVQSPSGGFGAAGTITVSYSDQCNNTSPINSFPLGGPFSILASNTVPQSFAVPSFPSCGVTVAYAHGAGASGTISIEYNFLKPGAAAVPFQVAHILTATTTAVKGGPGSLHAISINTTVASETIQVFDLPSASCVGSPVSNRRALITLSATSDQPFTQMFDIQMTLGVCIETSGAADLTVAFD